MSLLTDLKKKGRLGATPTGGGNLLHQVKLSRSKRFGLEAPTLPEPTIAPIVEPKKSLFERAKGFVGKAATGFGKFAARVDVAAAQLFSSTVDFSADFIANVVEDQARGKKHRFLDPLKLLGQERRDDIADRWRTFYDKNVGSQTEALKEVTANLSKIESIQPSKEWAQASTQQKFSKKHITETVLVSGPGVVASIGAFVINPALGFVLSSGSVANEINEIAQESGMDEDKSLSLGLATGLLVGYLDKIVPEEILSPQEKKVFIGALAKKVTVSGLRETTTEMTQEGVQLLVESTLREDLGFDEVKNRVVMAGFAGLLGGTTMQGVVTFANNVSSGDIGNVDPKQDVTNPKAFDAIVAPDVTTEVTTEVPDVTTEGEKAPVQPTREVPQPKKPVDVKTKEAVVSQVKKVRLVTEKSVQNVKNIKDVKTTLKTIRQNFIDLTSEVEATAIVAQEQREGLNVKDINQLKRIVARSTKFQEGDIETIRATNTGPLVNRVIENIQEKNPTMSEAEAFTFALDLPTQATAQKRTTAEIRELAKKEKTLSNFLKTLRAKQKDLDIQQDDALFKQWQAVVDAQEKLTQLIKVPSRQLPVGEGKEKVSRLEARLKGALQNASETDIEELGLTTFRQMNQADQIRKASEFVENNVEEAMRVVRGEVDPPKGILQNSVFAALVELGKIDTDVATRVATLTATRFGQEINILKKILADNPVVMMQDIVDARVEAYEKRTGQKAEARVRKESERIVRNAKPTTKEQWNTFIESIRC